LAALAIIGARGAFADATSIGLPATSPASSAKSEVAPESSSPVASDASVTKNAETGDAASEAVFRSAKQTLERGKLYPEVVNSLEELTRKYPASTKYNAALGIAYVCEALSAWSEILPDSPEARVRLTDGPLPVELWGRGMMRLNALTHLHPDSPDYRFLIGWAYLANSRAGIDGDAEKSRKNALDAFQAAIRLNPTEPTYYQALGDYYRLNPEKPAEPSNAEVATTGDNASVGELKFDAKMPPSPAVAAYRKVSQARPRDAGLHFILYQLYDKAGDADHALEELRLACRYDRSNAAPFYLLAQLEWSLSDKATDSSKKAAWHEAAIQALRDAMSAPKFDLAAYHPDYPLLMAPALQTALGDSLTPETLEIHDRLKELAKRIITEGDLRQSAGDPGGSEEFYNSVFALGQRLTDAALGATRRYLLRLPEMTAGLTAQESALNALRALYEKYSMEDRLAELRQRRIALDQIRQLAARGADAAVPFAPDSSGGPERDTAAP
jgi:tetratricopeptide (TPR) repeat protein